MPRFKLTIEYDGTPYLGWQAQENGCGVQNAVERAILQMTGENVRLMVAGRTDAGVHALAQVAHADLAKDWRTDNLRDGLNTMLGKAEQRITIMAAEVMAEPWHARLSARKRHYLYRIINRRPPAAIDHRRAWHVPRPLDADAMHVAAQRLVGHHDFTTFRAAACQARSPEKTLEQLDVARVGDFIEIRTSARSFLHNQVRRMVGSLEMVGAGRWSADDLQLALEARDSQHCGPQAPAWGLYFVGVEYGDAPVRRS